MTKYTFNLFTTVSYLYMLQRGYIFKSVKEHAHLCHIVILYKEHVSPNKAGLSVCMS